MTSPTGGTPQPSSLAKAAQPAPPPTPAAPAPGSNPALAATRSAALKAKTQSRPSPQLEALLAKAKLGQPDDIERLGKWAALAEQEAQVLRRRSRKQQHDFATLFEIVGQTSARALDVVAMQTYLLRTISGHFATPKLLIMRRLVPEDPALTLSAAQGVRDAACSLPLKHPLCKFALERRFCFSLQDVPPGTDISPLLPFGIRLVVPLIQDVEGPGAVLEGLLLLGPRLSTGGYNEEDHEFLQVLGKMLAICLRNEALYRRSIVDDLTGVASRGHFEAQLSQELKRIVTYGHRSMSLVLLDVDHFKHFNDTYGHQTGDAVLQELARVLSNTVRNVDLVARYGGEEFAIILLEIEREKAQEVAERLRAAVQSLVVTGPNGEQLRITSSFGVASFPDDARDKSTLIKLADQALYASKAAGRNCVTFCPPGAGLNIVPARSLTATHYFLPNPHRQPSGPPLKPMLWPGLASPELDDLQRQQKELLAESQPPAPQDDRRKSSIWPRNKPAAD